MRVKMKLALALWVLGFAGMSFSASGLSAAIGGGGCGSLCMNNLRNFCPTCNPAFQSPMPWGAPAPWWWGTGPMMYSNFYSPAPWYYGQYPGVMGNHYPGSGGMFAAKPNLYLQGPVGTEVTVKVKLAEEGSNWLASVPSHGTEGWKVKLAARSKVQAGGGTYGYLYSDYRMHGREFQDRKGFCAARKNVVAKMALQLKEADFTGREIADFIEYWSVKLPRSQGFCVYPQDERQLDAAAPLEISPKPAAVRRVLFMVQVEEGLVPSEGAAGKRRKFSSRPNAPWHPQPLRLPASAAGSVVAHEWGVGFFAGEASGPKE